MVTKGLNKITQNETQDLQLVDNFCKSWVLLVRKEGLEPSRLAVQTPEACASTNFATFAILIF